MSAAIPARGRFPYPGHRTCAAWAFPRLTVVPVQPCRICHATRPHPCFNRHCTWKPALALASLTPSGLQPPQPDSPVPAVLIRWTTGRYSEEG